MGAKLPLKQMLLRTLMGALILSAVVGIYAFLFGNFGHTEEKILFTTMAISYFSVSLLACAAAFEKKIRSTADNTGARCGNHRIPDFCSRDLGRLVRLGAVL